MVFLWITNPCSLGIGGSLAPEWLSVLWTCVWNLSFRLMPLSTSVWTQVPSLMKSQVAPVDVPLFEWRFCKIGLLLRSLLCHSLLLGIFLTVSQTIITISYLFLAGWPPAVHGRLHVLARQWGCLLLTQYSVTPEWWPLCHEAQPIFLKSIQHPVFGFFPSLSKTKPSKAWFSFNVMVLGGQCSC